MITTRCIFGRAIEGYVAALDAYSDWLAAHPFEGSGMSWSDYSDMCIEEMNSLGVLSTDL